MKMEDLSYRELSSWASVAIVFTMLLFYFSKLSSLDAASALSSSAHNRVLFQVVIVTVLTEILVQVAFAISKRIEAEAPTDERDQQYSYKAGQLSGGFLSGFVAILILAVSQSDWLIKELSLNMSGLDSKDILLSVLVVGFALSQLIHHLSLGICYRRGS